MFKRSGKQIRLTRQILLLFGVWFLGTGSIWAKIDCQKTYPIPALATDKSIEANTALDVFKGLFKGVPPISAQAQMKASLAQHDVLAKYPNADVVALRQLELSYVCQLLNDDTTMKTTDKIALLQSVGEGVKIARPVPPTRPSASRQQPLLPTPSPAATSQSLPKQIVQTAPQGIAIGGDNTGTAIVNNYGPVPLTMNQAQIVAVTQAVTPYSGAIVDIAWEYGSPETDLFVGNLQRALEAGGLTVKLMQAVMMMGPASRVTSGLAFAYQAEDPALIEAVARALVTNGYPLPKGGFNAYTLNQPPPSGAKLQIYVGAHQ
jgi:hypothetical protein